MLVRSRFLRLALLVPVTACASHTASSTPSMPSATPAAAPARAARADRTVITRDQMLAGKYATVYDAVAALRSLWLRPRGNDSYSSTTTVWVYLDNNKLGDVETLRTIQSRLVATVRFYDGPQATSRWGVGHSAGVIHVSTWSNGAPAEPTKSKRDTTPQPLD